MYSPPSSMTAAITRDAMVTALLGLCLISRPNPIAPQTRYEISMARIGERVNARINIRWIVSTLPILNINQF